MDEQEIIKLVALIDDGGFKESLALCSQLGERSFGIAAPKLRSILSLLISNTTLSHCVNNNSFIALGQ